MKKLSTFYIIVIFVLTIVASASIYLVYLMPHLFIKLEGCIYEVEDGIYYIKSIDTEELFINEYVEHLDFSKLEENSAIKISVDEGNEYYYSYDNGLYERKTDRLILGCSSTIIKNTTKEIADKAFYECDNLESIIIPDSVISIGDYAFSGCSFLRNIEISNNITSIGKDAFIDCNRLEHNVYDNVKYLGNESNPYLVLICPVSNSITTCRIHTNTKIIVNSAFYGCRDLENIVIPNNILIVGKDIFQYCNKLTIYCEQSIDISNWDHDWNISNVPVYFISSNYKNYTFKLVDENLELVSYTGSESEIVIPKNAIFEGKIYSITTIGDSAFKGLDTIKTIVIPDSVISIGNSAFSECTKLANIEIPNSVTTIGDSAFYNCRSLIKFKIPTSVTILESSVFSNCIKLTSIEIPESVTIIKSSAFSWCIELTNITIPEGVTSIDSHAFYNCSSLTSITIPEGVTSIGSDAFYNCSSLTNITIPEGVTSIDSHAFYNCSSLTSITIPEGVTSIGSGAFYNCSSLTNITIPEGVTSIGSGAFSNCSSLTNITLPFVGSTLDGETNTHLGYIFGASTYSYNSKYVPTSLKEVIITGGTTISSHAFYNCSSLTSITIPEGVTSIDSHAFYQCSSLTYNTYDNAKYLGNDSNPYLVLIESINDEITSCEVNENTKFILNNAFTGCNNLTSMKLPFVGATLDGETNTHFGYIFGASTYLDNSKYVPTSLKEVIITGGTTINSHAFYNCSSLTSITIPEGVTSIGSDVFSKCSSLTYNTYDNAKYLGNDSNPYLVLIESINDEITSCEVNENTKFILNNAFYNCTSLTSITIPDSLTSIGNKAFYKCTSLTSITIPDSLTSIGNMAFYKCTSLTSITIPEGVTSIGSDAFSNCSSLTKITLPDSLTSIGNYAFYDCSRLMSIIIPDSVTNIGYYAFYGCYNLKIYCEAESQPEGWSVDWNYSNRPVTWGYKES